VISQIDRKGPHAELRYRLTRWIEVGGSSVKLRTSAAESNQYNGNTSFSLPGNFQLSLARSESRPKLENNAGTRLGRHLLSPRPPSCCWLFTHTGSVTMAKKSSASSRRGKQISVSAESIFSKPLSKRQQTTLARMAKRQADGDDAAIDYSDIPPLTDEQLARFRRAPKVLVAARLDREVYDWLRHYGEGYSTRINSILRAVMSRSR